MKMTTLSCLTAVLCACSDDAGTPGSDADTSADVDSGETGDTGGDTGDGGVQLVEGPILERTPTGTSSCTVERPVTRIADADYQIDSLIAVDAGVVVTRSFPVLSIARAGLDGAFGEAVVLDAEQYASSGSTSASDGSSLAVVWFRQDQSGGGVLRFARVADDLTIEVAPLDVAVGRSQYAMTPAIVARPGGWALLYTEVIGQANTLRFVRLDAAGVVEGSPVTVGEANTNIASGQSLLAIEGGFAATWTRGSYIASEVVFARLDGQGAIVSGPHLVSRAAADGYLSSGNFETTGNALRVLGGRYFAAFTETHMVGGYDDQQVSVIARVAVFDGEGNGELHALQAPVEDMTAVFPSLHVMGDELGVLWSYGSIIYICGGCITDYDMHLVLLDPATLTPVAPEVVQLSDTNGFTRPRGAVVDGELFTTTALDFHALSFPATGVFACQAK